jgi:hypothetical protein
MHTTIEAVYDNGDVNSKIKFPTKKLGRIKNIEREQIYGDYLSNRH